MWASQLSSGGEAGPQAEPDIPPWLNVTPWSGLLLPGESSLIDVTVRQIWRLVVLIHTSLASSNPNTLVGL